jgi:hypothetical protein
MPADLGDIIPEAEVGEDAADRDAAIHVTSALGS